jgi:penicillin amidase
MTMRVSRGDLEAALPDVGGHLRLRGLGGRCDVWRDPEGIPHVRAASSRDAFFAQGFVHAQDRLWHMDHDRRRAYGRWAEYAGPTAVAQDIQMRRWRLEHSARADYEAVTAETRVLLDAYADGVNAFIQTTARLPIEYRLVGGRPEPWRPWDAGAIFKVRHILMGVWQMKAWRARLVRHLGAARAARLCPGTAPNPMLIVPPGVEYRGPMADGLAELTAAEDALRRLADWEQGSNSWALAGSRTASGKPLVAGDPHRALDVPNVYYQNHLACPEFDAIGLSFPGVPGLPHFGHNRWVAWCVTHTHADYQDLFVERFDGRGRYEFGQQWRTAETARETIHVRGAEPVEIEVTVTHHGPVLLGDPRSGHALALRDTATAEPNTTFDALLPMLLATSADELLAAVRPWVDPVNNFVFADVHGAIGYRTRGKVPVRAKANAWVPVPGWDGAHEWQGFIPFEAMPEVRDPSTGWVATANSKVTGADYPHYLGLDYAPDFRTRRLAEQLRGITGATVADLVRIHADRVSLPARAFVALLDKLDVEGAAVRRALEVLREWDGVMDRDSVAATIYSLCRERLLRNLMAPLLGPLLGEAFGGTPRAAVTHMARLRARLPEMIRRDDRALLPGGDWPSQLKQALAGAVTELEQMLGPDMSSWRWGRVHATQPQHTLSVSFPELAAVLDPPSRPMGGDGDTVQAASYVAGAGFGLTSTSVARYVFDLGDWERSAWVVPLGASGHPGSRHYADQAPAWAEVRVLPMRYDWARIRAEAESHQALDPA